MIRTPAMFVLVTAACSAYPEVKPFTPAPDSSTGGGSLDAAPSSMIDGNLGDAPLPDAPPAGLDCSTRPPPAGWTRLTTGYIQSYGSTDNDPQTNEMYWFNVPNATTFASMFGFYDRQKPLNYTYINSPYAEKAGAPTPVIYPQFPAQPGTNAVYGPYAQKAYYALAFTMPALPTASGVTSLYWSFSGSSSNHGSISSISISECPGDFSPALNTATGTCLTTNHFSEGTAFYGESGYPAGSPTAASASICHLTPGKTYYFNMAPSKNGDWSQSSCTTEPWCWTTLIRSVTACNGPGGSTDCGNFIRGQ